MQYFQHFQEKIGLSEDPGEIWLHSRGPYFWIEPGRRLTGKLIILHPWENQTEIERRLLFFPEDYYAGKCRIVYNRMDLTGQVLAAVAQLRRKRLGGLEEKTRYAIHAEPLTRFAFQKFLKTKRLCSGVFLQAKPGSFTAIMGPSGCGKSVFLKMLAGCDCPSSGRIVVMGTPLDNTIRSVGYVPQGDVILPELTAEVSLDYTLRLFAPFLTGADRKAIIAHVAENLELPPEVLKMQIGRNEWQGQYPSGGQRRRISLAHELVRCPDVLLLDEPTSGLSTSDGEKVMDLLGNLSVAQKMTIVVTVHSPSRAMYAHFDDLLLLGSRGRICYYGPAADAFQAFALFGQDVPDLLITALDTEDKQDSKVRSHEFLMNDPDSATTQYHPEPLTYESN